MTNLQFQSGLEKISQDFSSKVTFEIDEDKKLVNILGHFLELKLTLYYLKFSYVISREK